MGRFCLFLSGPAAIEERLFDALLDAAGDEGFASVPTFGHGTGRRDLSPTDQVAGRSAALQVQTVLTEPALNELLQRLREGFRGTGLRYWAVPLALEGRIE